MANDLEIPKSLSVPAHLAGRLGSPSAIGSSIAAGLSSGEMVPRITKKGSRFRIKEGNTETVLPDLELKTIIVGANPALSRTWYTKKWQPGDEPAAPDCYSMDGVRPAGDSSKPQSDTCASCPQQVWGSMLTDNGQKLKACSDAKRLAVIAADDPEGPVYLLIVGPSELKGLNQYHKELEMRGIPAEVVITKLAFDTTVSHPKLLFKFGGFVDEATARVVDKLIGTDEVKTVTGENHAAAAATKVTIEKPASVRVIENKAPVVVDEEDNLPQPEDYQEKAESAPVRRGFTANANANASAPSTRRSNKEPPPAQTTTSDKMSDSIKDLLAGMDDD